MVNEKEVKEIVKSVLSELPKPINLEALKIYTKEFTQDILNKVFPVNSILLTKVKPDRYGYPFLADLIDGSEWLPLENNRMLRIMNSSSQPMLGGGIHVF